MQILAGYYKGHKIKTVPNVSYRPTKSRVRKSIFDQVGPLTGGQMLDLFAGSGIMGFEAASRGANTVVFVEHHRRTMSLIQENGQKFPEVDFRYRQMDSQRFLEQCEEKFNMIYIDPPYQELSTTTLEELVSVGRKRLAPGGWLFLEMSRHDNSLKGGREKYYGDTRISIWRK